MVLEDVATGGLGAALASSVATLLSSGSIAYVGVIDGVAASGADGLEDLWSQVN